MEKFPRKFKSRRFLMSWGLTSLTKGIVNFLSLIFVKTRLLFFQLTSFKEAPWWVREVPLGFLSDPPPVEAEDWTLSFRVSAWLCTWPECRFFAGFGWSSGGGITGSLWDFSTLWCTWISNKIWRLVSNGPFRRYGGHFEFSCFK